MALPIHNHGDIVLKDGVTLEQVVKALIELDDSFDQNEPIVGPSWSYNDGGFGDSVELTLEGVDLHYYFDGNGTDFLQTIESWLEEMTKLAADAWVDYSGDDEDETYYGPDQRAILIRKVRDGLIDIETATASVKRTLAELVALGN